MDMPAAGGFKFIVAARDDLTLAAEGHALRSSNVSTLAAFFWEAIFCWHGAVKQVITDNGPEIEGAFRELLENIGFHKQEFLHPTNMPME